MDRTVDCRNTDETAAMPSWSRIAAKLTRDGRLAPVQQMGNLRDGFALSKKKEYLFSLKWCKMCVVAYRLSLAVGSSLQTPL